ncbi:1,4-alpha-glucan branching protein GlgB [Ruania zhangjianzhongii]|uniref:1,4-alpha-glucan branching protein GlgB n=1 Tax=Ruania zhangjianzhongii TaxID=2603206 RepID=UPI0011C9A657|nr:1,4-alpha-glucan branching protein GlgB [Ruania zhangjianzhongii]
MSEPDSSLLLDLIGDWVREQRWFPAKDAADAELDILTSFDLPDPWDEAACTVVLLVLRRGGQEPAVLQVPLVATASWAPDHGLIASLGKREVLVDGPHHPAFLRAWLAAATPRPGATIALAELDPSAARVHTGEQSNTSVRIPGRVADGETATKAAVLKIFRVLAAGPNPDLELVAALREAGWRHVPDVLAGYSRSWPDPSGSAVAGDLGVLTAFVPAAEDGFELACGYARTGRDLTPLATDLGACVAQLHTHLRTAVPAETGNRGGPDLAGQLRQRAQWALDQVPALGVFADGIEAVIAGVVGAQVPPDQRIHGDLHLGQVLHGTDGWYVLDFEGEPLRPLAERRSADQPLRDVAGMLRSFDYAAAVGRAATAAWAEEARGSFLAGYRAERADLDETVLRALELDKALYEAVYEQKNRPDWLPIPLTGIRRLTEEQTVAENAPPAGERLLAGIFPSPSRSVSAPAEASQAAPSTAEARPAPVPDSVLATLATGAHFAPHDVLGPHLDTGSGVLTIRVVAHLATAVQVRTAAGSHPAEHVRDGIWAAAFDAEEVPDYRLQVTYADNEVEVDDPYRFLPTLGEVDQHLIAEGRHEKLWEVLGSWVRHYPGTLGEVSGVSFAVWAPNARAVRVVGDFNGWDGRGAMMRSLGSTGVWEVFLPGLAAGERYKYEICVADGSWHMKADPMARATEVPPATASVVTESRYTWADQDWMAARAEQDPHSGPLSVYEVHLGSWRKELSYLELAEQLVEYVTWMNFTHVELLPVAEHPFGGSWGYQVTSYYAPTSRFGSPDEFRYLVDALHRAGIGVILDWVPAHFPKDAWALARFDGTPLYEDPDPLRGEQKDWGTYVFNFGRNEVRNFLVANAVYWLTEFHVDALRVDAVASMLYLDYSREAGQWRPNARGGRENLEAIQFLQEANATAYRAAPGTMMIAEESTAWPGVTTPTEHGGLGYGLKWNMGWMNDTLRYLAEEPINRRYHHGELTFSLVYAFSEQFVLPLSHDEVVHGKGSLWQKMPGDLWAKLAGVRLLLAYQWTHPGKKLLFMGGEFAQNTEWNEAQSLNWELGDTPGHAGVREMLRRLNQVYADHPALWAEDFSPAGFEWLEANDGDHNVLAYLRKGRGEDLVVVANFAGSPHEDYRVGVPTGGTWVELLNTDHLDFGGSGVVNTAERPAEEVPWHGRPQSIQLRVPPLGVTILRRV